MPSNIFINYRKDDSRWNTQALYNGLLKYFPKEAIFKDFNTIQPGEDFVESINKALEQCQVLLVVISKDWIASKNAAGQHRLHDPVDFVRLEIATALKRKIRVIPVLFDNIEMPQSDALPEDLQPLTRRQFVAVSDQRFDTDVQRLSEAIKAVLDNHTIPVATTEQRPARTDKKEISFSSTRGARVRSALILGVAGAIVSGLAYFFIYSTDERMRTTGGRDSFFTGIFVSAGISGVLWAIAGAIAGTNKKFLRSVLPSAFITLFIWIWVYTTYRDVVWAAIVYGMPMGAMLGMFFVWLLSKLQPPVKK
jgi:TIR domain